jgi:hypothetical protein
LYITLGRFAMERQGGYDRRRRTTAMFTGRGWSYSNSRRRRHRGAIRVRRRQPRLVWLALPALVAVAALAVAAFSRPELPTPQASAALLPLPTESPTVSVASKAAVAPTATPTRIPTRVPTLVPTPTRPAALLPEHRILSFYGNPLAREMGILGEIPPDQMLQRLKQQIALYSANDPSRPFVPALELVTPAAQGWPGEDGLYRARMKPEVVDQVAGWAEANNMLLILDVQIGLSTVPEEVDALLPYLRRPYVHLALDPEFAIPAGHIPGEVVGSLDASAIDGAVRTLSELVTSDHLPPKILVVHRFTDDMVTNAWAIAHTDPNVQIVVTMDGFGSPALKLAQYRSYVRDQGVQYSGIKLFYHHDVPLLTPPQVLGLDPSPDLVIYQ